jgi:hypothetical protein
MGSGRRTVLVSPIRFRSVSLLLLFTLKSDAQQAPLAGRNVNMVSGTTSYKVGDPFLQRQNEVSIVVSSRNVQHLFAGANDYRTVDLSFAVSGAAPDIRSRVTRGWESLSPSLAAVRGKPDSLGSEFGRGAVDVQKVRLLLRIPSLRSIERQVVFRNIVRAFTDVDEMPIRLIAGSQHP